MRRPTDSNLSVPRGGTMKCYLIANNEMRLDVWTRQRREINKFQRMMQPPSPPAFLCHSFAPSNEVVNGSFDTESFSTKSRIDSHASLLVLAALQSCVIVFRVVEKEERKIIENAGLNVSTMIHSKRLTSNSSARVFASFSSLFSLVMMEGH